MLIDKQTTGLIKIFIKPGQELIVKRDEIRQRLQGSKSLHRIAGFDIELLREGIITIYYNPLRDPGGKTAEYEAERLINCIEE